MGIDKKKILASLVVLMLIFTFLMNSLFANIILGPFVLNTKAGGTSSSWHNSTWLNVTIEAKRPRILWYDFQKCTSYSGSSPPALGAQTWSSRRNNMTETDNETWYRFIVNISSDQGWDNIDYINITCWHDNGSLETGSGYNTSNNLGANRNFYLQYENTTGTAVYRLIYPSNNSEVTKGNFLEYNVTDSLGVSSTEAHNLSFVFKPGYQFRYASGPGESSSWVNHSVSNSGGVASGEGYNSNTYCWESFNNTWSWNFNITVENHGESWEESMYRSWVNDEFGIYAYTEIVSAGNAAIQGAPGGRYSTNSSSHFNQVAYGGDGASHNVSVRTRSNGNYSMTVNVSDLEHVADNSIILDNTTIFIRGGTRTSAINFSDSGQSVIFLYGSGTGDGTVSGREIAEVNGTWKDTGEAGDDGLTELYPTGYSSSNFNSQNSLSHYVEFNCEIPLGQQTGKYTTHVFYHLRTQTHQ